MNKTEFLRELEARLKGLPKEDVEERLEFYSEAIDDRVEDGLSEEDAVKDIGDLDDVVTQIASDTSLSKIIKGQTKNRAKMSALNVILLILGFPLWLPLLITILALILVLYVIMWVLVLVAYVLELSVAVSGVAGLIVFFAFLFTGAFNPGYLAVALLGAGLSIFFFYGCKWFTIAIAKLSKGIFVGIKKMFIVRG